MKIEYICICMLCIIFLLKIQYNKECFNPNVFSPIITSDLDMNLRNALGDKEYENIISRGKSKKRIITKPVTISNNEILDYDKNYNISPYDNIELKTTNNNCDDWKRIPTNLPLVDDKLLAPVLGTQVSLTNDHLTDTSMISSAPTLDGTPNTPNRMFMFSNNIVSPLCCPSTYMTSSGCICTTKNQRDFISSRGLPSP